MDYAVSSAISFLLLQASIWLSSALLLTFVFIYNGDNLHNEDFWHSFQFSKILHNIVFVLIPEFFGAP